MTFFHLDWVKNVNSEKLESLFHREYFIKKHILKMFPQD